MRIERDGDALIVRPVKEPMALVCPITTANNGFPLHLSLSAMDERYRWVTLEKARAYDLEGCNARVVARLGTDGEFMRNVASVLKSFY